MPAFIDQLARICSEHLLAEKVVIAPSLAVGHQIGDRLARSGTPWVNLRVETVRSLVESLVLFDVAAEGQSVVSRAEALALVERACAETLGAEAYFSTLSEQQGLVQAVQQTLDDLRHAAVALDATGDAAFEVPQKRADLDRLLRRYESLLDEEKKVDRTGLLVRALRKLREEPDSQPQRIWIDMRDGEATAAESELIERLTGGKMTSLRIDSNDRAAALRTSERTVALFAAVGEENEVRELFRRVLSAGGSWDSVEVVYTQRETYLPLIFELASQYEVPCTFAEGIPAAYTRPGRAALGFLRWIADDFSAIELQRTVGGSNVKLDDPLTPLTFVRSMRRAAIGWGRDRYLRRLDESIASFGEEEGRRIDATATRALVERLLGLVPLFGATVALSAMAHAAREFVRRFARSASEVDGMAASALGRMLDELSELHAPPLPAGEVCARLIEAVKGLNVGASNPRPGLLHVAGLTMGGYCGREQTFVVGLDDSKYPGKGLQDPILLDSERRQINDTISPRRLPLLGERPRQKVDALWRVIAASGGSLTLSFSSRDLLHERDLFPAAPLLEVFRLTTKPDATYADLIASLRPSTSRFTSDAPLDGTEWWLSQVRETSERISVAAAVCQVYPWIESGLRAEEARESEEFTRYDGAIEADPAAIDPRRSGKVVSSSQIEKLAKCPFSWFLKYVLGLNPVDELVRDPLQWLDAMQSGNLLHSTFQHFMEELKAAGQLPCEEHSALLDEIADRELRAWREKVPPPNEAAVASRVRGVREACSVFLRSEIDYCKSARPLHFEAAFGMDDAPDDGISSREPVEIPLGDGLTLRIRGRIDRVDQKGEGEFEIWDYKTGSAWSYRQSGSFHGGTLVQHAIYSAAFEELLRRGGREGGSARRATTSLRLKEKVSGWRRRRLARSSSRC